MVDHGLLSYPSMASPSFKKLAMEESQKPATIIRHGRYLATLKYIWKKVSRYIDFLWDVDSLKSIYEKLKNNNKEKKVFLHIVDRFY
jgi:hypothetical protein